MNEGLKCHLLIEERVDGSSSEEASGNNLLFRLPGAASITPVPGGTHAGLVAGLRGNQSGLPVTGVSVRAAQTPQEAKILELANRTGKLAGSRLEVEARDVSVRDEFVGPGYSLPTPEMTQAIQLFVRTEGILLDPVYRGKTAAGLVGMIPEGAFTQDEDVLFIHNGGSPAIYAYPHEVLG